MASGLVTLNGDLSQICTVYNIINTDCIGIRLLVTPMFLESATHGLRIGKSEWSHFSNLHVIHWHHNCYRRLHTTNFYTAEVKN